MLTEKHLKSKSTFLIRPVLKNSFEVKSVTKHSVPQKWKVCWSGVLLWTERKAGLTLIQTSSSYIKITLKGVSITKMYFQIRKMYFQIKQMK